MRSGPIEMPRATRRNKNAVAAASGVESVATLREEVRDALLDVLRSATAPAMAKASAGRTLIEMMREDDGEQRGTAPITEMSEAQIDEEIARLKNGGA